MSELLLHKLKEGDNVVLDFPRGWSSVYTLEKVQRVTKTLIVVKGMRFYKDSGIERKSIDKWQKRNMISYPTRDMLQLVKITELENMASYLKSCNFSDMVKSNPDLLEDIYNKVIK